MLLNTEYIAKLQIKGLSYLFEKIKLLLCLKLFLYRTYFEILNIIIGTFHFLAPSLDVTFLSVKILTDGRTNLSSENQDNLGENVKIKMLPNFIKDEFYNISNH